MAKPHTAILVFIPCYNCAAQIGRVIDRLAKADLPDIHRIVVVDNRSTDDTVQKATLALESSGFADWKVLVNDTNVSLGGSHKVAFAHAREAGFSHVLIIHGDDQAEPANFRAPLRDGLHHTSDAVLGGRFLAASRLTGYGWFRIFGNHVFNGLFRLATRRPIQDLGSGLNIYGPAILKAEDERSACDDLTFHCDLLITMIERHRRLTYVPVDWREDDQVSNAKLFRQSWRILKILAAHAFGVAPPKGRGKHMPAANYTSTTAAESKPAHRTVCAVCGSNHLQPTPIAFTLPAYQGCVDATLPESEQIRATMTFDVCRHCDSAQIRAPLAPEVVYQGGHATGLGAAWARHHDALAAFLARHSQGPILEFGGGAGTLARRYRQDEQGATRPWTIVEPNAVATGAPVRDLTYEEGFFGPSSRVAPEVETVLFCHCLEHLPSIRDAARILAGQMLPGRRIVVAWPDLERWIETGTPGAINWEHSFYCTIAVLTGVFHEEGFQTVAEETFGPGHSHFLAFERQPDDAVRPALPPTTGQESEPKLAAYFATFRAQAETLNAQLDGRPYYLAPASIYAQALIAGGLSGNCRGLIDNAPVKQGRVLYGTDLMVQPPTILGPDDCVVINGGAHGDEIAKGLLGLQPTLTIHHAASAAKRETAAA